MKTVGILVGLGVLALGSLIVAVAFPIVVKNGLIAKDVAVDEAWAQIDTQLQRRADLIPNLVNTVKGYAKHEKEIFENISKARSQLLAAKGPEAKANADAALTSSLGRLLAVVENYPNLKADASFVRLQDELAGTENRITVARTRYNRAAKEYNMGIRKFPGSLFAAEMKRQQVEYYQPPDKAKIQAPPEVKF